MTDSGSFSAPDDCQGRTWEGPGFVLTSEPLEDAARARLVAAGERVSASISEVIDEALGRGGPSSVVRQMDWAFLRFGTVLSTVRFGSVGAITAMIARSLIDDAVLWDWAAGLEATGQFPLRSAAAEWRRLGDLTGDLPWLLPPGTSIVTPPFAWLASPSDQLKRLGSGAGEAAVAPLRVTGLAAVNDVLAVFAHSNIVSLFACPDPGHLPAPLAAAAVHLAGAASAAVVVAAGDPSPRVGGELEAATRALAVEASAVHELPAGAPRLAPAGPVKTKRVDAVAAHACARRFPDRQQSLDSAIGELLASLDSLGETAMPMMDDTRFSAVAGRLSFQTLMASAMLFRQDLLGESATWNTPFAGRLILELGAFWGWALKSVEDDGHPGESLRAFGRGAVAGFDRDFRSAGLGASAIDRFLGPAASFRQLGAVEPRRPLPRTSKEMLRVGYGDFGGAATRVYRLLSQFVHSTGLAVMHLVEGGPFGTLSEPMRAVAAAGFALGADRIADYGLILAVGLDPKVHARIRPLVGEVSRAAAGVLRLAETLTGVIE